MSKSRDIADSAATINYIDNLTSDAQTQLNTLDTEIDNISVTSGSLTKTFTSGEAATITLSGNVLSPVVGVTKEVSQTGVTNNTWDVNSTTENYTRLDSAPATTLDFVSGLISGAKFVDSFSVSGKEGTPRSVKFNTDGTKMFITGNSSDSVHEYTLSTAFDVSSSTFSQTFDVSSQVTNPVGVVFNNDGTKMFITSDDNKDISEYDLSTGFDISTATYSQAGSISSTGGNARNSTFNDDGTKIYVCDRLNNTVDEYALSTAFDISTLSYTDDFSVSSQVSNLSDVQFNSNELRCLYLAKETTVFIVTV